MSACADAAGPCIPPASPVPTTARIARTSGVYGRKWNALDPEQVVEETTDLVSRYNLELLWIVDDNFLVDKDRALSIAEGLVRRGVHSTGAFRAPPIWSTVSAWMS